MRKIEQEMLDAIRKGKNWQSGNTSVSYHHTGYNAGLCSVFLHGNRIAIYDRVTGNVTVEEDTFKQWPTATTVSRLRALGVDCKGGKHPELNGAPV